MTLTAKQKELLGNLVTQAPLKLDTIFGMAERPDMEKGACSTYSRVVAEVLGEFNIYAEVKSVLVETANRVGIDYLRGKITFAEAARLKGRVQIWGDIREGQQYQHAVCYLLAWGAVVDLAMTIRASGLVPSHPYWLIPEDKSTYPWWLVRFEFKAYRLEYRAYETNPEKVKEAKAFIRDIVRKYYSSGEITKHHSSNPDSLMGKREACIEEIAEWYAEHRREMEPNDLRPIALKYFPTDEELTDFYEWLASSEGRDAMRKRLRFVAWREGLISPLFESFYHVTNPGDTIFSTSDIVSVDALLKENERVIALGQKPAVAEPAGR